MYGNDNVQLEDVIKVCKEIGINDKIETFDNGYDTIIDARNRYIILWRKAIIKFC